MAMPCLPFFFYKDKYRDGHVYFKAVSVHEIIFLHAKENINRTQFVRISQIFHAWDGNLNSLPPDVPDPAAGGEKSAVSPPPCPARGGSQLLHLSGPLGQRCERRPVPAQSGLFALFLSGFQPGRGGGEEKAAAKGWMFTEPLIYSSFDP